MDGKLYRINDELEVEEGKKKIEEGIKTLRREIKLKRERGK